MKVREVIVLAVDKKPRAHKRTYAVPKADVAQALGVGTMSLVRAEEHVAAVAKYPLLGAPEVSPRQALELAKDRDGLPPGEGEIGLRGPSSHPCFRSPPPCRPYRDHR